MQAPGAKKDRDKTGHPWILGLFCQKVTKKRGFHIIF
jgi:hypothetical protein